MRFTRLPLAGLSSLLLAACAERAAPRPDPVPPLAAPPPATASLNSVAQGPLVLSVLGLNDLHGRIRALPAFAGYLNNVRQARAKDGGAVAVVDAGDMFQGTLESNLTEGASVIAAYEMLGMTAAALGNHEFDFGPVGDTTAGDPQGAIRARIAQATFPILSANLVLKGTHDSPPWDKLQRSALVDVGGVRIGFVGLLTHETPAIVMDSWFRGLDVDPLAPALAQETASLRARGAQLVIALAHAGADCKDFTNPSDLTSCTRDAEIFDVANALPAHSVDAIFAGHTHAGVAQVVNGIPIAEAYARGRAFSRIDFSLDRVTHRSLGGQVFAPHDLCPKLADGGECISAEYEGKPTVADAAVAKVIEPALALAEARREMPLGCMVSESMSCEHASESPLGNLFADLLRASVKGADVALLNGGSLRANLPAGELSYGELFEAMPFDNLVARVRITGAELKAVILAHLTHDAHGLISLSGIRVTARCGSKGPEVKLVRENGRPVSDRETLLLATSDYVATGGDGLLSPISLPKDRITIDPGSSFRDMLATELKQHPQLSPRDPAIFNPARPRVAMSTPRPLVCSH